MRNDGVDAAYLVLVFVMAIVGLMTLCVGTYHEIAHWQGWECSCK